MAESMMRKPWLWRAASLFGIVLAATSLAIAQPKPQAKDSSAQSKTTAPQAKTSSPADEWKKTLDKSLSIEWNAKPLHEAVAELRTMAGVNIILDEFALMDAGVDDTTTLTCAIENLPLRLVLNHVLHSIDLAYKSFDDALLITTPERASVELVVRVYDVLDLVRLREDATERQLDYDSLIELITTIVQPTTWDEVGGPSSIGGGAVLGCLTISQTAETHEEIAQLLAALRRAKDQGAKKTFMPVSARSLQDVALNNILETALDKRVTIDFEAVPLSEVRSRLQAMTQVNVLLDRRALEDSSVPLEEPITAHFHDISLRSALKLMLSKYDLETVIHGGTLFITTPEKKGAAMTTVVYPIGDLLPSIVDDETGTNWISTVEGQLIAPNRDISNDLVQSITSALDPSSWDEVGGTGSAFPFANCTCLVVRQLPDVHRQILTWFGELRQTLMEREKSGRKLAKPTTGPATAVFMQMRATKDVPINYEQQRDNAKGAATLITATIEPKTWTGVPDHYALNVGSMVIVRHEPAVLRKVSTMLSSMGFSVEGRDIHAAAGGAGAIQGGGFFNLPQ